MDESFALDHVIIGVADLDDAAALMLVKHGLISVPGGEHPQWGTRNRVIPLGDCYLELVEVADPQVAAGSGFGSWVAAMAAGEAPWGWVVRTSDLDATAARLGLDIVAGRRVRPDGVGLSWRSAGVPAAPDDRLRPFFLQWDEGTPLPGSVPVPHPAGQVSLRSVAVSGVGLDTWLGAPVPLVEQVPGLGGVERIDLVADGGDIVLSRPLSDAD
jgi:hypothetical protein